MQLYLIGIVEDGLRRSLLLPANARKTIRIPKGGDLGVRIQVFYGSGGRVDLSTGGASIVLSVKRRSLDVRALITKTVSAFPLGRDGTADLTFVEADTKSTDIAPMIYLYDVWLTQNAKRENIIPISQFIVDPAAQTPP